MPAPPFPYLEMSVGVILDGHLCVNIFHYTIAASPDMPPDMDAIVDAFDAQIRAPLVACLAIPAKIKYFKGKLFTGTDIFEDSEAFGGIPGTAGATALPNEAVACIRKHFDAGVARIRRGHTYISGVSDEDFPENYLAPAARVRWLLLLSAIQQDLAAGGGTFKASVYSPSLNSFFPITYMSLDSQLASLRRRRPSRDLV